jgi:hypothetical protein
VVALSVSSLSFFEGLSLLCAMQIQHKQPCSFNWLPQADGIAKAW